jgi:hypothetical protein
MQYDLKLTPAQVEALAEWTAKGAEDQGDGYFADVLLVSKGDNVVAGQGDERAAFNADGELCCERCGALDGEELQGGACYSCGLGHDPGCYYCGRPESDHGDNAPEPHDYVPTPDVPEPFEDGTEPGPAGGEPEAAGDRIAREGAATLAAARDVDYDPADPEAHA